MLNYYTTYKRLRFLPLVNPNVTANVPPCDSYTPPASQVLLPSNVPGNYAPSSGVRQLHLHQSSALSLCSYQAYAYSSAPSDWAVSATANPMYLPSIPIANMFTPSAARLPPPGTIMPQYQRQNTVINWCTTTEPPQA